jgi:hypothetical protein
MAAAWTMRRAFPAAEPALIICSWQKTCNRLLGIVEFMVFGKAFEPALME